MNPFKSEKIPDALVRLITCTQLAGLYEWDYVPSVEDGFYGMSCGKYVPFAQTVMQCFTDLLKGDVSGALTEYTSYCNAYTGTHCSLKESFQNFTNGSNYLVDKPMSKNYGPIEFEYAVLAENFNYHYYIYHNFELAFNCSMVINIFVWIIVLLLALQKRINSPWLKKLRAKFTPTIGTTHHTESKIFGWYLTILPTRGETWFLLLFLVANVMVSCWNYPLFGSMNGEGKLIFLATCIANRTGGLAFGLLPLTILLAGRNNIISELTAMPYSCMMFYHKWAARMMTVYGCLHGALWILYCIWKQSGLLSMYLKADPLWSWGIFITFLSIVILLKSTYLWKSRNYEMFLTLHILFAILFFYGCFKHCETLGWLGWIFLSIGIWFADRLLRIIRISKFGGFKHAYGRILDTEHEIFQIRIPNSHNFKFFPGCYAFLYVWNTKLFWHSHPFTLMRHNNEIEIIIKAKAGMTKELYEKLPKDGSQFPIRIALEGPYGHEAPIDKYDHALLVTSGTAVPGPISYLQSMQKIEDCHFVWVISNEKFLNYMRYSLEPLLKKRGIFDIYITRPLGIDISWVPSVVNIYHGRPNIQEIVHQDLSKWKNSVVISCALPFIDDQIRNYVAEEMKEGTVDFYDELQVW